MLWHADVFVCVYVIVMLSERGSSQGIRWWYIFLVVVVVMNIIFVKQKHTNIQEVFIAMRARAQRI